jgi:two-component system sensor histidine kinase UhpB
LHAAEFDSPAVFRVLPSEGRAGLAVVAATGLAGFAAQWIAVQLWIPSTRLATVWLTGGLALAVALVTDPRRWPAVLAATLTGAGLLFLTLGVVPLIPTVLLALAVGFHSAALAYVVRSVLGRHFALSTLREFLTYLCLTAVGSAVAASLQLGVVAATGIRPGTFEVWRTWVFSGLLGYLTVTPTLVLLVQKAGLLRQAAARRQLEAALLIVLLALASGLVFSGATHRFVTWTAFAMTLPPLLVWSAVRFGTLGASASLLLVSVISTFNTSRALGPFTSESPANNTLSLQLFIMGIGLPLLGLAVVLSEQQRTKAALQASQQRLRGLNRELIAAREEEASRIARELHDDVGQRLALLSIGLSRLRKARTNGAPKPTADIVHLQEQTSSIAATLRQVSHQLHPAILEHVGLSAALQTKCEEVRQATGLDVRMANHGDISGIPRDIALCVFRVAQEALNNAVRHSGARTVDLSVQRTGADLLLQVTDDGRGFAVDALEPGPGLGLRSARDRVGSVGGTLAVETEPGAGTTVRVTIPLETVPRGETP